MRLEDKLVQDWLLKARNDLASAERLLSGERPILGTGLWIKLRFSPITFPKAEKNSLKGQKSPLSGNFQLVSSHLKAFGKVKQDLSKVQLVNERRT